MPLLGSEPGGVEGGAQPSSGATNPSWELAGSQVAISSCLRTGGESSRGGDLLVPIGRGCPRVWPTPPEVGEEPAKDSEATLTLPSSLCSCLHPQVDSFLR